MHDCLMAWNGMRQFKPSLAHEAALSLNCNSFKEHGTKAYITVSAPSALPAVEGKSELLAPSEGRPAEGA